jgi:hypothetical protein
MANDPVTDMIARLSQAWLAPREGDSRLPALPSLNSGLPDVNDLLSSASSGFPTIGGGGSSGFDYGLGQGSNSGFDYGLGQGTTSSGFDYGLDRFTRAGADPFVGADALSSAMTARRQKLDRLDAARAAASNAPDVLTEPMLADAPTNVARWYGLAKKYADQYQVPVEDIMAIIENESGGDPGARSGENPGQGRAVGLMQLMSIYHGTDGADLTDPETNISRGVRYYAQAFHKRGNDSRKAMAEFFGGGGAFDAMGNVREDIGDINIKMGPYLDGKFLPAKQRWAHRLASGGPPTSTVGASSRESAGALNIATHQLGKPYVFGGADLNGFDCSGLIQWSFAQNGKRLPRTAQEQWNATQRLTTNQVAPGDLVFFKNTYNAGTPITHVGIYAGGGRMLMAMAEGQPIQYVPMSDPYWQQHLAGYGRVV